MSDVREKEDNERSETEKKNYERLLLAIAILYSDELGIDIEKTDDYSKLTEGQKTYAKKIYEEHPTFRKQVEKDKRIAEKTIVKDAQRILKEDDQKKEVNGSRFAKWVTVGDQTVCDKCQKWKDKIVCVEGDPQGYPTVDDVIRSGGLHYGCRCALLDIDTSEIELKSPNPRASTATKLTHPEAYNHTIVFSGCCINIDKI